MYKNTENFEKFLKENLKQEYVEMLNSSSIDEWIEELVEQHDTTGSNVFELSSLNSKTGNTVCYRYETETKFFLGDDEVSGEDNEFDYAETVYVF